MSMNIKAIYSFLVHPSKNEKDQPPINGVSIPLEGGLFDTINAVFSKAPTDCNISIAFNSDSNQFNPVRKQVIELAKSGHIDDAQKLAQSLQEQTTRRSGLGLLFTVIGENTETGQKSVYLSRFPADMGIMAEEGDGTLKVELLERVFMKSAVSYKAVYYSDDNFDTGFWTGQAIDKQITNTAISVSTYWIKDFLKSDFKTTSATGTRRLAKAIQTAMSSTNDIQIKEELAAVAVLARSLNGVMISMDNFGEKFNLSQKTIDAMKETLNDQSLQFDQFQFSKEEFGKIIKYKSVVISNGATLTAPANSFDECFQKRVVNEKENEFEFITTGSVTDERLRKDK